MSRKNQIPSHKELAWGKLGSSADRCTNPQKHARQKAIPRISIFHGVKQLPNSILDSFMCSLRLSLSLRMVRTPYYMLYPLLYQIAVEHAHKFATIIRSNDRRGAISTHNIFMKPFREYCRTTFLKCCCFWPFSERVDRYSNVSIAIFRLW